MPSHISESSFRFQNEAVAIVGIDCILPDSCGADEFWQELQFERDHLKDFPAERSKFAESYLRWIGKPVPPLRRGNYLPAVSDFDYRFFNITPKEAAMMNPNQRLLLQTVYHAFQDAGISAEQLKGSDTGIYIGYIGDYDGSFYSRIVNDTQPDISSTGSLASMNAGRIAYLFDLHGPAVMIDTACSSSLVAIYQAYRAIQRCECRMAIAAGVRTVLLPDSTQSTGIESSDGITRTFDKDADGTGIGEGAAAILLKPLHEAIKDHDRIYAVIRGGAVNQDGTGIGLTAPNVNAQISLYKAAWRDAGIDPQQITYIEAHGTGTKLGDPIEIRGLQTALRCYTEENGFCAVGSVKSNYGHLYDCAGIISVIKTALMLKHRTIVPTINYHAPNPEIELQDSPLYIASALKSWKPKDGKRIAGVSAFGFSGTNCHLVLEEYAETAPDPVPADGQMHLFTASAKSKTALWNLLDSYRILAFRLQETELSALCTSTQLDRSHELYRAAIPVQSVEELREKLELLCDYRIADEKISPYKGIYFGMAEQIETEPLAADITALAQQYVTQKEIGFEALYYHRVKHRMKLPLYPFDRLHCCITIPEPSAEKLQFTAKAPAMPERKVSLTGDPNHRYSETERYLADIFAEKMGYDSLSVQDDIYALGGDSITAYHIVNRINTDRGTALTMADILEQRTIRNIAALIDSSTTAAHSQYTIQKAPEAECYPLSYAQQRMYFLYLMAPDSTAYNMPFLMHIHGALDTARIEQACRKMIALHDVFRTHFEVRNGTAVQWVSENAAPEFVHLNGIPDDETLQSLSQPFDLSKDVLMRIFLFHIKEGEEYAVLIDMNHISADGSSLGIMISELNALYEGQTIEKSAVQYTDFAVWQRNLDLDVHEQYWLNRMRDLPDYELPIDHPRSNMKTESCEICGFRLSDACGQLLHKRCNEMHISVFALLFAVYQASLAAFADTEEVVTGTPISGRTAIETQDMVGMFVNVLPLRTFVSLDKPFSEFAQQVHIAILEMLEHQDYPFDRMVEKMQLKREEGRNPVYDTVFALQNMRIPEFRAEGLQTELINTDRISKFDLTAEALMYTGHPEITFKYNPSLFEQVTVQQLMRIYENGLNAALEQPDEPVGQLFAFRNDTADHTGFDGNDFDF